MVLVPQARNRRLAADLQSLQQQLKAKDDAMVQMQDRLAGLEQEARHKAALVQSLERDLLQASQNVGSTVEGSRPASAGHAENGAQASGHHASGAPSSSLLSIITSQRDRFRGRCLPELLSSVCILGDAFTVLYIPFYQAWAHHPAYHYRLPPGCLLPGLSSRFLVGLRAAVFGFNCGLRRDRALTTLGSKTLCMAPDCGPHNH